MGNSTKNDLKYLSLSLSRGPTHTLFTPMYDRLIGMKTLIEELAHVKFGPANKWIKLLTPDKGELRYDLEDLSTNCLRICRGKESFKFYARQVGRLVHSNKMVGYCAADILTVILAFYMLLNSFATVISTAGTHLYQRFWGQVQQIGSVAVTGYHHLDPMTKFPLWESFDEQLTSGKKR